MFVKGKNTKRPVFDLGPFVIAYFPPLCHPFAEYINYSTSAFSRGL